MYAQVILRGIPEPNEVRCMKPVNKTGENFIKFPPARFLKIKILTLSLVCFVLIPDHFLSANPVIVLHQIKLFIGFNDLLFKVFLECHQFRM